MRCNNCGQENEFSAKFCQFCGAKIENRGEKFSEKFFDNNLGYQDEECLIFPSGERKSPILAAILSLFIAGLGQIYLGQIALGTALIFFDIVIGIFLTAGLGYLAACILTIIWAYLDAKRLNSGLPIHKWRKHIKRKS